MSELCLSAKNIKLYFCHKSDIEGHPKDSFNGGYSALKSDVLGASSAAPTSPGHKWGTWWVKAAMSGQCCRAGERHGTQATASPISMSEAQWMPI